ncbi:hypothetical protein [Mesorhizobium sp.]|uniref:hypothetical protein n=1 Tax=Mesorhizobium sp. TaxID=1871066 RepID=UPI0025CBA979|nr:hypothetical protein [Mesorhizobium sp.]
MRWLDSTSGSPVELPRWLHRSTQLPIHWKPVLRRGYSAQDGGNVDILAATKASIAREPRQVGILCGRENSPLVWAQNVAEVVELAKVGGSAFVFDPSRAIDPRDIAQIDQDILGDRKRLQGALVLGLEQLKQTRAQILAAREHSRPESERLRLAFDQPQPMLPRFQGSLGSGMGSSVTRRTLLVFRWGV